jgi:hypothetical protein
MQRWTDLDRSEARHQPMPVRERTEGWWYVEREHHEHEPPLHPPNSRDGDEQSERDSHGNLTCCKRHKIGTRLR